ncbi:SnoaL-like domain-containing protein [Lysobacter sp. CA199]|uniref:SnoaL-like domain-containing protein n=1 Tax=Lysobacter sp. CA199 TaxID=3455608 RepID=UPI003F8D260D
MDIQQIADRYVALCREGKHKQITDELYADDAVSVEAAGFDTGPLGNVTGADAIREKGRVFQDDIAELHDSWCSDAVVGGNWFTLAMGIDATYKSRGRMAVAEVAVYRVENGKIVHEQFFYG